MSGIFEFEINDNVSNPGFNNDDYFDKNTKHSNSLECYYDENAVLNINYKSNPEYYNSKFKYLTKLNLITGVTIHIEKNRSDPIYIPNKKKVFV